MSLGLTDGSAKTPSLENDLRVIQAHCRRIVNQNKRIMARDAQAKAAKDSYFTVERCVNNIHGRQQLWRRSYLPIKLTLCAEKRSR
jgi:hypothetical protein